MVYRVGVACPDEDLARREGIRKRGEFWCSIFSLYAKRIVRLFDEEVRCYFPLTSASDANVIELLDRTDCRVLDR